MTFLKPVYNGNALAWQLNYVKRSSMDVEVTVEAENLDTGERVLTGTALVTTVALQHGKPIEVNPLILKRFHEVLNRLKEAGRISQ